MHFLHLVLNILLHNLGDLGVLRYGLNQHEEGGFDVYLRVLLVVCL